MNLPSSAFHQHKKEDVSDYVAHLQIHMSLQSRNLLPQIDQVKDSRDNLLYQTQANIEKLTSRELI
ncbi:hypothetical protein VKI21_16730 [Cyanobacterium aponinum UTEX 3222]|uniref:Uncharacterized protein n=2 Tax=Cyanobacterium aponinum TaxID=379064 RepID=K9Z4E4_CYAAP|nr:hypothetical protein [Cyanobacterium aponinum]AFZ53460.1 hypothetical protein Cyan10605_1346 [Cyanobacterium aponinum PCC 10605]MBD2393329.1 hypothetical protein [Cyanobacterium aponinum FACHB-4101]MTF38536.1 hypothetical protein [Cyanobacterium aponinum 0216]WRL41669.1 hypothetical protein VKI21_16730 [Cyanobacterium aponinum UTEX 3222]